VLPGLATTLDRQLVIPLPCLSDCVPELTVEMTCGVQLAFERPHEFLCLPVNVELYVLHGNCTPSAGPLCNDPATLWCVNRWTKSAGLETEDYAINAVPEPGRGRPIFEDMAQMPATLAAVGFRPNHSETAVRRGLNRALEWGEKAGPSGPALELALSFEERLPAADTAESARPVLVE
jgi:hypothetical protein